MKFYFILFVLIITSVLIFSCEKKQHGNFTVSGYYYSQDSVPIADKYLYVFYEYNTAPLNTNNMSKTVGEGYTDSLGYFEFICEYYIGGSYSLNNNSTFKLNGVKADAHIYLDTIYWY